ncbi:pseudouridine synthase [Chryseolinea sp. H1M3-3]|uniref:RluA family pseudouridine synthase n=1 Tax=Chryseolinea sp. H1M3-3 TaxID=3034144 RepID=UPI0023EDF2C3|nr:pseudouridine synthase [Chryseolinea sp. H1M3-3]
MKHFKINFADIILFEDDNYILVNKPPFLSTLEDRNEKVNLLRLARTYCADAQVCHRLDKDTSGVLAIAKNPEAYRHLSIQFEKRQVTKLYHAVVDEIHQFNDTMVDQPILKQDDGIAKISKREGRPAVTYFTSIKSYRHHTLLSCRPITGRMHQIRLHLSYLGAPITGDELYGGKPFFLSQVKRNFNLKKDTEEQPVMKRMALHAFSLEFSDLAGTTKTIEAPYPKDFQVLIKQLDMNE